MSETRPSESNKGIKPIWQYQYKDLISPLQNLFGPDYASNPTYQAILKLFENAGILNEKFKKQVEEIESLRLNTKKTISDLKKDTIEFKKKISNELGLWRYFIIGALVVIGVSFITLTLDTFWKRGDQLEKISKDFNNRFLDIKIEANDLKNVVQNLKIRNPYLK